MKLASISLTLVIALATLATLGPASSAAAEDGDRHAAVHFGLGLTSAFLNLGYGPIKVLYAGLGTIIGGVAWGLSGGNEQVARAIIQPAVRGDYVIVPENLTNEKPLVFAGKDPQKYGSRY